MNLQKHYANAALGAFKTLLAQFPILGAVIGAWEGYVNSRSEEMLDELSKALNKINEEKIDKDFIATEEFMNLFLKSWRLRLQTYSMVKAKIIVGILIESMQKDRDLRFSSALKETFIGLLDRMSDCEIEFLKEFLEGKYQGKTRDNIYQMGDKKAIALDGLISVGILQERNTWERDISQSMLGREFIAYVKVLATLDS